MASSLPSLGSGPDEQIVVGPVGVVTGLRATLDSIIAQRGDTWTSVAKRMNLTRQGLAHSLSEVRGTIEYDALARVCAELGVEPSSLFKAIQTREI